MDNYPSFAKDPTNELFPGSGIFVDYNYPSTGSPGESPMFSIGDTLSQVGDYVWEPIKGTWVSLKDELKSVGNDALSGFDNILGTGMKYVLLLVAGVVILIWVLGKSGVSGDISKGAVAFFGVK